MSTTDFTRTKLRVIDAEPNAKGNRLQATFTLHLAGMAITSCHFVEKDDGIVWASAPKGKTERGYQINTAIVDRGLARSITRRAAQAYCALTGRELSDE